jgi:hypothetical protein
MGAVTAAASAVTASATTATFLEPLIPQTPQDQLLGFMRLFAGTEGSCVFTNEGVIYGRAPDDLVRPLIGYLSVLEIRPERLGTDLFRTRQIEAMVYLDLATRMPIRRWENPLTGERLTPVGYVSPENVYYFDTAGSYARARPEAPIAPTHRDWRTSDTDVWMTESRYNSFPSGIREDEFPRAYAGPMRNSVDVLTYRARIADFSDHGRTFVPSTLTMMTDAPWPLWMMMGRPAGGVFWHGQGAKYPALDDVPAINRQAIEAVYPGFLAGPWRFPAAEWGTAAQLRRLRDAGELTP